MNDKDELVIMFCDGFNQSTMSEQIHNTFNLVVTNKQLNALFLLKEFIDSGLTNKPITVLVNRWYARWGGGTQEMRVDRFGLNVTYDMTTRFSTTFRIPWDYITKNTILVADFEKIYYPPQTENQDETQIT